MVNSMQLFSSIVSAIREVEAEAKASVSQRQSKQDNKDKQSVPITSSRQIPMHARLNASTINSISSSAAKPQALEANGTSANMKERSKFSKRFNMTGSGMSQASGGLAASH